ncbi:MAG: sigma-70 family RNA polymerase sigma factor [Syntrophomonadaceae bacterium]|nr:sigma-70 family RNA polymerase sigma factor [Syntrophomonadaceae bacterium]
MSYNIDASTKGGIELQTGYSQKSAEEFFNNEYAPLYRYALYLVKDKETAQDLCQEVFLRWFNSPHSQDIAMPRSWLKKVLSNLAFNYLRHQQLRFKWENTVRNQLPAITDCSQDIIRMEVEELLSTLAWKEQILLKMKMAGLSYAEMAEATGLAIGSVGTMLMRAMRKFKTAYEEKEAGTKDEMSGSRPAITISGERAVT